LFGGLCHSEYLVYRAKIIYSIWRFFIRIWNFSPGGFKQALQFFLKLFGKKSVYFCPCLPVGDCWLDFLVSSRQPWTTRIMRNKLFQVLLFSVLFCIFFITVLTGCATQLSEKWQLYEAGQFSFSMPPTFQKDSVHGIDSYVSEFTNEDMVLNFDYGAYSGDPLDDGSKDKGYDSHIENIAGHRVQIVTFNADEHSGFRFNHIILASFLGLGLTMEVQCRTESNYGDAKKIFRSVKFKQN
jgi:hypothetical protein